MGFQCSSPIHCSKFSRTFFWIYSFPDEFEIYFFIIIFRNSYVPQSKFGAPHIRLTNLYIFFVTQMISYSNVLLLQCPFWSSEPINDPNDKFLLVNLFINTPDDKVLISRGLNIWFERKSRIFQPENFRKLSHSVKW